MLIWSYAFYFTSAIIFLLSIPITIMRCMQGIINLNAKTFTSAEIGVWVLRIWQYLLMVGKGNQIPVQKMAHSNTWHHLLHRLNNLSLNQWIWDIAIYCLIFGMLNLAIMMIMKILRKRANDSIQFAAAMAVKNMFVIPVSAIYLLKIMQII